MHEFGIIQAVFETVEKTVVEYRLKSVKSVTLQIGKLRQCVPDFLQFAFEELSKKSVAKGAKLIIKEIPIRMQCEACHYQFEINKREYICPKCHETRLKILSGQELFLENIEGES